MIAPAPALLRAVAVGAVRLVLLLVLLAAVLVAAGGAAVLGASAAAVEKRLGSRTGAPGQATGWVVPPMLPQTNPYHPHLVRLPPPHCLHFGGHVVPLVRRRLRLPRTMMAPEPPSSTTLRFTLRTTPASGLAWSSSTSARAGFPEP